LFSFSYIFYRHNINLAMSAQKDDANLDTPDPTTGLTPRQRQFVVDTWGVVKPNAKEAGVEMFTR
jgi:hypothetical protein